jgi:16S rRNA (cytosine1402-N4)-methyltransferase
VYALEFQHEPVLLNETIKSLEINPDGIYVDGTAGGGGHSSEILKRLNAGRLICIDKDPDAISNLKKRFADHKNVSIIKSDFTQMNEKLKVLGVNKVDGILLDIGVSSHQLDNPERGFSYHNNAELDMRMSKQGISAKDIVNKCELHEISKILKDYGEEKYAYSIAKGIVKERQNKEIETTYQLVDIIKNNVPASYKRGESHPARKTFQAIRIAVNDELQRLSVGMDNAFKLLKPGGVLAIITFHSLEDRIVKQKMLGFCAGCTCPPEFPICVCNKEPQAKLKNKKPIVAGEFELSKNKRSRSAKLRVCTRV